MLLSFICFCQFTNLTSLFSRFVQVSEVFTVAATIKVSVAFLDFFNQFRLLGNCPPTPPLIHHFALRVKEVVMLA